MTSAEVDQRAPSPGGVELQCFAIGAQFRCLVVNAGGVQRRGVRDVGDEVTVVQAGQPLYGADVPIRSGRSVSQ